MQWIVVNEPCVIGLVAVISGTNSWYITWSGWWVCCCFDGRMRAKLTELEHYYTENIIILGHTIHILFYFSYARIFHTLIFKLNYFLFPPTNYFLHYEPNTDIIDFFTTQLNSEVNTGSSREPGKVVLPDTTFKWLEMDTFRCSIKIIPGIIKNKVVYFNIGQKKCP